jgi:hypothetical protein
MNSPFQPLLQRVFSNQITQLQHFTPFRSILAGAGMYHAIEQGFYPNFIIAIIFPSAFAGFQAYKHRDDIRRFIVETKDQSK